MILLIQCSMIKSKLDSGPARDIYRGQVFLLGIRFAEKWNLEPYILSGKYGIIKPDDIIENYDLKSPHYNGPWPTENGYWLGGKSYFKNAPSNLKPLIVGHRGYGDMKNWLGSRLNGPI